MLPHWCVEKAATVPAPACKQALFARIDACTLIGCEMRILLYIYYYIYIESELIDVTNQEMEWVPDRGIVETIEKQYIERALAGPHNVCVSKPCARCWMKEQSEYNTFLISADTPRVGLFRNRVVETISTHLLQLSVCL